MRTTAGCMEMDRLTRDEHEPLLDEQTVETTIPQHPGTASPEDDDNCKPGLQNIPQSKYVVLCALFSALGGLLFGYDQGVVSVILVEPQFLHRFWQVAGATPEAGFYKGLLTAMIEFGALLGAFNQGWIADRISRKYSIMVAAFIFIVGSVMQTTAISYDMLVFARFVGGIGIGMLSMVTPLYISEISPPEIRGSLLVLEELSIVTGIVVAFWTTYATRYIPSEWAWRLPFGLQIIPGALLGVGIFFLPFSPRWLVAQDRDQDALQSLCKLRQLPRTDERMLREWNSIRSEVAVLRELDDKRHPGLRKTGSLWRLELASWMDLFREDCWPRTRVGTGIMFFQQFVGINALIYYAPTMLQALGLSYDMQLVMSGVINMAQLMGVFSSLWTMDRMGRRTLLLAGSLIMFACHLVIAVLVGRYSDNWSTHATPTWTCVALLLLYMLGFGATWGPVPWAIPSEIFPAHLRAKGVAISSCSNWLNNFIIGLITPPLVQNSAYGAYLFFAFFCLLSLFWTYFFVPETAGRSLEEMDVIFQSMLPPARIRHDEE